MGLEDRPICRLHGKVLGLLGFGKIAGRLAAKAKALGLVIIAHDPYLPEGVFSALGVKRGGFEELLSQSDFLSIHVPLTKETRHLIDAKALSLMKPTACLINTSRGAVVDEQALVEALKRGQLAGACLDVLEKEPPDAGNELLQMPRVLISPHVAWYSRVRKGAPPEGGQRYREGPERASPQGLGEQRTRLTVQRGRLTPIFFP